MTKIDEKPSGNGNNGRDSKGRFAKGYAGGPGNPLARQTAQLRTALHEAVTPEDIHEVVAKLIELAKEGQLPAIKELLSRVLGPPVEHDLIARLEAIEQSLESQAPHARAS